MPPPGCEPFLAAICENPDDDLVRLVYADWLDDHGDPTRAEFIRVQVERAVRKEKLSHGGELATRDRAIQKTNALFWQVELPYLTGVRWGRFWRGFVAEASFGLPTYLAREGAAVFAVAPIQFLTVREMTADTIDALLTLPRLANVRGLKFISPSDELELWQRVSACPALTGLRYLIAASGVLQLSSAGTPRELIERTLLESPVIANLKKAHPEFATGDKRRLPRWMRADGEWLRLGDWEGYEPM